MEHLGILHSITPLPDREPDGGAAKQTTNVSRADDLNNVYSLSLPLRAIK
jgi:hypothetical protein